MRTTEPQWLVEREKVEAIASFGIGVRVVDLVATWLGRGDTDADVGQQRAVLVLRDPVHRSARLERNDTSADAPFERLSGSTCWA